MKKIAALFISTAISVSLAFSQDLIMKKNGDEIKTKVEEITSSEIKYKKFDNLEGPTYSIAKSEVFIIKYANGTKEVINQSSSNTNTSTPANTNTYAAASEQPQGSPKIDIDGGKYYQYNRRLSTASLNRIIQESNKQDAVREIKSAKVLGNIAKPLIVAGIPVMVVGVVAALIGAGVNALEQASFNSNGYGSLNEGDGFIGVGVTAAVVGAASITTGIILNGSSKSKTRKAVSLYNAGL